MDNERWRILFCCFFVLLEEDGMHFFSGLVFFLGAVYVLQRLWWWPNHEKRFRYLPEEKILLSLPKIRRRVYYCGRYGIRAMEENLGLVVTTQRLLFTQQHTITQIVDFRETNEIMNFRGPYYWVPKTQILWEVTPQGEQTLKVSFVSLGKMAYFEILDLPQERLSSYFPTKANFLES